MKIAEFTFKNPVITILLTILFIIFGIESYTKLGRLALPNFTIKRAMIQTRYPGANPKEVEEEVTDVIEEAVQKIDELDYIKSISQEGLSVVYIEIKPAIHSSKLPQVWDELRKKVSDVQKDLPPGALSSKVFDDFGDVYSIFFAITGDGYSYAELKNYAKLLKKELLLVKDVAKIDYWGIQDEAIYVEFDRAKISTLGISPEQIYQTIELQNVVEDKGKVRVNNEYLRFHPSGNLSSIDTISNIYIGSQDGKIIRLKNIAKIYKGYKDPPHSLLRFNSKPAIGFGISIEENGNVVKMGEAIQKRLQELKPSQPSGMNLHIINFQPKRVTKSLDEFLVNFAESVAIVLVLMLLFMGIRTGFLISFILILTILTTFIGMYISGTCLQLISLGGLIIALGMLVDNAIVIADVFLIKIERGISKKKAAYESVKETQLPLLGATLVAILAFTPIGFNTGNVGEFCRSLFNVIALSLLLSWIFAITIVPLFSTWFLKQPKNIKQDPYDTKWYRRYRSFLIMCIHNKKTTLSVLFAILILSLYSFSYVDKAFFEGTKRNQFIIDYWKTESTHIYSTKDDISQIEEFIMKQKNFKSVTSFIGEGALRFILSYLYHSPNTSYAQVLVEVKDYYKMTKLMQKCKKYIENNFTDSEAKISPLKESPPVEYKIEVRFRGPDIKILKNLASQAKKILYKDNGTCGIRTNWRQKVKVLKPLYSEIKGRRIGITRSDVNKALLWNFSGTQIGLYRKKDELIPIISRPLKQQRVSFSNFKNIQVYNKVTKQFIPIRQVVDKVSIITEDPLIDRRNRVPTITVQCSSISETATKLRQRLLPKMESIKVPNGYSMEWGGEYEEDQKGQAGIKKVFPVCLLGMFVLVVGIFNSLRQPIIIFLTIPLAFIGVSFSLLIFKLSFGFLSILGFLGLTGMLVKNTVVLFDQINLELKGGKKQYQAVIDSSVSRLRPVSMAAGTTILGMAPLVFHPFFASMAATMMGGLLVATILTLLIAPVLYIIFFRVPLK